MVTDAKAALRRRLRSVRAALASAQRTQEEAATCAALRTWLETRPGHALAAYAAARSELDLGALCTWWWSQDRRVLLPRVAGPGRLAWHAVAGPGDLTPGAYGIREPDPARCPVAVLAGPCLLLVPGLGFAADGRRLGQGGGFYDRLLPDLPAGVVAVGVGFACQRCDDLPVEAHDHTLDHLLLAGRWLRGG